MESAHCAHGKWENKGASTHITRTKHDSVEHRYFRRANVVWKKAPHERRVFVCEKRQHQSNFHRCVHAAQNWDEHQANSIQMDGSRIIRVGLSCTKLHRRHYKCLDDLVTSQHEFHSDFALQFNFMQLLRLKNFTPFQHPFEFSTLASHSLPLSLETEPLWNGGFFVTMPFRVRRETAALRAVIEWGKLVSNRNIELGRNEIRATPLFNASCSVDYWQWNWCHERKLIKWMSAAANQVNREKVGISVRQSSQCKNKLILFMSVSEWQKGKVAHKDVFEICIEYFMRRLNKINIVISGSAVVDIAHHEYLKFRSLICFTQVMVLPTTNSSASDAPTRRELIFIAGHQLVRQPKNPITIVLSERRRD